MKPLRAIALIALLLIAAPSVAAQGFSSATLEIDGRATVDGPGSALFLVTVPDAATWEATASSVAIERVWTEFAGVERPEVGPLLGPSYTHYFDERREILTLGASELSSSAFRDGGALLVRVATRDFTLSADLNGILTVQPATDPRLDQGPPPDLSTSERSIDYTIHERVHGEFLNLTADAGVFELTGDLVVTLFDADYALTTDGATNEHRTGKLVTDRTAYAVQGRVEVQTLTLRDAVLRVRTTTPATLLSTQPVVAFDGTISAASPEGMLPLAGLQAIGEHRWAGRGALLLSPRDGAVGLDAPAPLAATGALHAARTPPALAWALGAVGMAALAALAVLAVRRRATGGDDLELALLAMGERRWQDALPHLDRLVAKAPSDPVVLMDRAICLEEAGRLAEAREGYERTLQVEPHSAEAHYYYARTLARLRMSTAAMAHLSRALALDGRLAELARGETAFSAFADHPQFRGLVR